MVLHLKNMVCFRCKLAVEATLKELGYRPLRVELGEVELAEAHLGQQKGALLSALQKLGFEVLDNQHTQQIEKVKKEIIALTQRHEAWPKVKLSQHLAQKLGQDYSALSKLFSDVEGQTIEQYFIQQRIEKAKELLVYDELSLSQIADRLHYSSPAYLSNQFKKVTGLSPSHFKKLGHQKRRGLDQI